MKYVDVRDKIRSGDVLAWTHRTWKTWYDIKIQLIRIVTRSEYVHTGVAWVIGGRVFVIESVIPTVRIVPLSSLLDCYWIPLDEEDKWIGTAEEYTLSLVGKAEYSQIEAIKSSYKKGDPEDRTKWYCSKLSSIILNKMGRNIGVINTPSDVVNELLDEGRPIYKIQ